MFEAAVTAGLLHNVAADTLARKKNKNKMKQDLLSVVGFI